MASRTVGMVLGSVQRSTGGAVPLSDIYEALLDANRRINANYPWPWTYKDANVSMMPSYTTGTISITDQTNSLVGVGTTWVTSWVYKKIVFTVPDYSIASFGGATTATLSQNINTGQNWTGQTYTIYQDVYALPSDCEPADVVCIVNTGIRYRLLHIGRYTLEQRAISSGVLFTNYQDCWCDAGYDDTNHVYLIRVSPAPAAQIDYRIVYRKRPAQLSALTDTTELPETYDKCLELLTEAEVRRKSRLPGYQEAKQEGYQLLQNMRKRTATAIDDRFSQYSTWPPLSNVSMIDAGSGLVMSGPTSGQL